MKTCLDCLPCLTRNAVTVACKCSSDPAVRERIVTGFMQMLAASDRRWAPPLFAGKIMDLALKEIGNPGADPYRTEKEKSTALAKQLLGELKNIPEYDPASFESRLRLAVAGNILYKEVEVTPLKEGNGTGCDMWENELLNGLVERLLAVDERVRADKASRKYTRAEVLAMLDEIDPSSKTESEAAK